jgi:hypothetical protein
MQSGKGRVCAGPRRCAEAQLLLGHDDEALAGLEKAIAAGGAVLPGCDPYWARLKDTSKYRQLMAR